VDTAHAMVARTTTGEVLHVVATRGQESSRLYANTFCGFLMTIMAFILPKIGELQAEVDAVLGEAGASDEAGDAVLGEDRRGDELPQGLARPESRLQQLRQAEEAIEQEAKEKAAACERAGPAAKSEVEVDRAGAEAAERAKPEPSAERNFTDPEARVMKTDHGFDYAYNARAVVDEEDQVVLTAGVSDQAGDVDQLVAMVERTEENLTQAGVSGAPKTVLADAGYCSEDNLAAVADLDPDVLAPTGCGRHGEKFETSPQGPIPRDATGGERMARRLRPKKGRADYARRKAIVGPAFGQMRVRQHAGEPRLRGPAGAQGEWTLHVTCHNLGKLANAGGMAALAPA